MSFLFDLNRQWTFYFYFIFIIDQYVILIKF